MKRYAEYKDSGVDWIGNIPQRWGIKKFKYTVDLINVKGNISDETYVGLENIESYTGRHIITGNNDIDGVSNAFSTGDILLGKLRPYLAKCIIADFYGVCSSELLVFRNFTGDKRYLHRLLLSNGFLETVNSSTYGSKMPRASWGFIGQIFIPLPNLEEQQAIADYLDQKTSAIDTLIADKQKLMGLLKEKRQAIICEAVTKGLDKTAKMKNSGIEWIGEIPNRWSIKKLSYVAESLSGGTPSRDKPEYWENGDIPWMSSGEINNEYITETKEHITQLGLQKSNAKMLPKNTVMMALNGQGKTKGMSAILGIETTCNQSLVGFVCKPNEIHYEYLYYSFKAMYKYVRSLVGDESREGLSVSFLRSQRISVPSMREQIDIVLFIKEQVLKIDSDITDITSQIEKLKEYRQSVISEAVTGKVAI